jgi:hypothetical protein
MKTLASTLSRMLTLSVRRCSRPLGLQTPMLTGVALARRLGDSLKSEDSRWIAAYSRGERESRSAPKISINQLPEEQHDDRQGGPEEDAAETLWRR